MEIKKNIQTFQNAEALFKAAAEFIIDAANRSVEAKGKFTIALSGGHTPEQLYSLLAEKPFSEQMPWKNTFVFWGDERCVPLNDERNNAHMAISLLLAKVDIPSSNIHRIHSALTPAAAAIEYEKEIHHFFKDNPPAIDLILLGLGEDGHTASLLPNTEVLHETMHLVKEVLSAEQNIFRVTMTVPMINQAKNILFLITGKQKAGILKDVLNLSGSRIHYPAQLISPADGDLYWFADKDAASLL